MCYVSSVEDAANYSLFQLGDLQSSYNAAKIVCYVSSVEDAANFLFVSAR